VKALVRNFFPCDLQEGRWVGTDEDHPNAVAGLNSSQGQMVMADGSARQSTDSDFGFTGVGTKAHIETSGGVTQGPASTKLIGCFGGCEGGKEGGGGGGHQGGVHGLLATCYTGRNWDGTSAQRIDNTLDLPWGNNNSDGLRDSPTPQFHPVIPYNVPLPGARPDTAKPLKTAKWEGQIQAQYSEDYTFHMNVDNEAWIFLDGNLVLHRGAAGGGREWVTVDSKPIPMQAGQWFDIEVRYKEWRPWYTPQYSNMQVHWSSASIKRGAIPCKNMRPPLNFGQ
jgi:hypothetical protein